MKPYTLFPLVYDSLLKHVDYERWYEYIRSLMFTYSGEPGKIIELGCGTGRFGGKFSRDRFEIYGMDNSMEMLRIADARAYNTFRIFCGDMMNFRLAKKMDFIFSVHDTMNYFLDYDALSRVFRSVKEIMHRESIFMFDITTEYNILKYFNNNRTDFNIRGLDIEWKNEYDSFNKLIYSILTFKNENLKETETHVQRIYSAKEISALLEKENFKVLDVFGDYTYESPKEDTVMINFITKLK